MNPIKTPFTNREIDGSNEGLPSLPVEDRDLDGFRAIVTTWNLTPEERMAIAEGANIEVALVTRAHPPISCAVSQAFRDVTPADWGLAE